MTAVDKGNTEANAVNQTQETDVTTLPEQEGSEGGQDTEQIKNQETVREKEPEEGQESPKKTPEEIEQEKQEKKAREEWEKNFGKPESGYDYKDVKLPEGMTLNKEITRKFDDIAGNLNLTQEKANEFMALAIEHTKQTQTTLEQAFAQAIEQKIAGYKEDLQNDPELGGANLTENLRVANLAYRRFSNNKVENVLSEAGLNNHPEVVRMFHKIGKFIDDDVIHEGYIPAGTKKTPEQILYGNKSETKEN